MGLHQHFSGSTHVAHGDFGDGVKPENSIARLLKQPKRLLSTEAQLVLRDYYENDYGIYPHEKEEANNPFAMVLYHWCEDSSVLLHEQMKRFVQFDVKNFFGLSWIEFMKLSTSECEMIMRVCADEIKKRAPLIAQAEQEMKNAMNK
jgi:hypothetical protein